MADDELLWRAVERARRHPFFVASSLLPWADRAGYDNADLAAWLGCAIADLSSVLLCRRPTGTGPEFLRDVTGIAGRFGMDATRLAEAIRLGNALDAMRPHSASSLLLAARDRDEAPDPARDGSHQDPAEDVP